MGAKLGGGGFDDINMTPLIDIVLVVLIIMMVNIPISVEEMGVKLPGRQDAPRVDQPPADQLVIAVYEDGDLALNRKIMQEESLFYEITRRLRPMAKKNVFIDAHPKCQLQLTHCCRFQAESRRNDMSEDKSQWIGLNSNSM